MGPIEDAQGKETSPAPTAASAPAESSSERAPVDEAVSTAGIADPISTEAPAPSQEPTPAPAPEPTLDPAFSERVEIPAQDSNSGGEWQLLVDKVSEILGGTTPQEAWQKLQLPIRVTGGIIILILALRVYQGLLDTINSLPLAPGLLELVGLIQFVRYLLGNMLKSSERRKVLDQIGSVWKSVTGR